MSAQRIVDTASFQQTAAKWIAIVEQIGFKLVHSHQNARVWWLDGVLLFGEISTRSDCMNSATALLNFRTDDPSGDIDFVSRARVEYSGEVPVYGLSFDARYRLWLKLNMLRMNGTIMVLWDKRAPCFGLTTTRASSDPDAPYLITSYSGRNATTFIYVPGLDGELAGKVLDH